MEVLQTVLSDKLANLTDVERDIFLRCYKAHRTFTNQDIQLDDIVSITSGDHSKQVHVHYKTEWYHYEFEDGRPVWY